MSRGPSPTAAYTRTHRVARKAIGARCEYCGATSRMEAALRPDTPAERLVLDTNIKSLYSLSPNDYFALCVPCHRRLDHVELRPNCRKGHAYTPGNTSIKTDGARRCLTCHRENEARRMQDPEAREAKRQGDRAYREQNPRTPQQKERKIALQRLRRQRTRD